MTYKLPKHHTSLELKKDVQTKIKFFHVLDEHKNKAAKCFKPQFNTTWSSKMIQFPKQCTEFIKLLEQGWALYNLRCCTTIPLHCNQMFIHLILTLWEFKGHIKWFWYWMKNHKQYETENW